MKYEVLRGQAKVGSYEFEELKALYQSGVLLPTDFFWIPGMPDWKPLSSLLTPKPSLATSPSVTAAGPSSAKIMAASKSGSFAYSAWMVAAFLAPYLFSWRIIFDKTLGYSKGWKIFYALWIPIVLAITSGGGRTSEQYGKSDAEYRASLKAHPYDVDSDQERPQPYTWAISAAEQLIRGKLKSPSSAKFSPYKDTSRRKTYDDGVVQYYVVSGWVESQNSFGAMLRSDYTICIKGTEDSTKIGISYLRLGEQVTGEVPVQCKSAFSYPEEDAFFKARMALAEKGDPVAQYDVGTCFEKAKGTKVDMAAAQMWFRKSGEQGNVEAAFTVGLGYTLGSGVEKDPVLAVTWYKKAAYGGHAFAQFVLANQYTTGNGVEKDLAEAYALYNLAVATGGNDGFGTVNFASKNLADLEKEITPADVEKGKRRIVELKSIIEAGKKK